MTRGSIASVIRRLPVLAALVCLALISVPSRAQDDDPPPQAGRLSIVNGSVSIQPAGTQDWGQAYLNYPLGPGDRLFTDSDGRAEIQVGRTYVRLGANTDLTFIDFRDDAITFGIGQGSIRVRSYGLWEGQSLYVQTPSGTATARGAQSFRVDVFPDQQTAIFTNNGGDLYISGAGDFGMDAAANQSLELVGTNPVYPQWLQPNYPDALDDWSESRTQQIDRATWRYVSPEAPGAEELDAYGQWSPGTEYGDMWFPSVQAGWSPYHNGHWINHAPWGWVWVEDEPWGYAPFHYGRWINYHGRWGWVPGAREAHPVWSPALVAFAGGISFGGGGVSVWIPLGPGEPYRPWYPCSPRYVDRVNITNIRETNIVHVQKTYVNVTNVTNYTKVTNVTNITNVTNVTNVTYVNRTTGATAMRQQDFASGRPVAQAAVHVDPQQMAHVQVIAKPQVEPSRTAVISAPPAKPVPVAATRPVLINAKGMAVTAQPKAKPIPPPVKAAPAPPSLPNRTVVAPPPNVKMTPAAQKAMQTAPKPVAQPAANRPGPPAAVPGKPAVTTPTPAQHPTATTPPAPAQRPAPVAPNQPKPAPTPTNPPKPAAQPPAETAPRQQQTPPARTSPPPQAQPHPTTPPPQAQPRPEAPPPHTAPPPQAPKPNAEPVKPAPRQQQPPPEKKKPEDKDKEKPQA